MKFTRLLRTIISHSVFKSSAIVMVGSTLSNFSGWLYHIFVGRILGPAGYAELSALLALFFILNVFCGVIQTVLVRFFSILKARNSHGESVHLYWISTKIIFVLGIIGLFIIIPLIPFVSSFLHIRSYWYFIWVYLIFATSMIGIVNGSVLQGYQRFIPMSIFANISMTLRLISGMVCAFFGVGWTLIGNVVSNIVSYLLYFFSLSFLFQHKETVLTVTKKQAVQYGIPVLLATLGITIMNTQDILLVKHFFPNYETGIYSSLSVLGKVVFYASAAVGMVLFPIVAEKNELKSDFRRSVSFGIVAVSVLSLAITIGYFLFPNVALIPFGNAFRPAEPYLGWFGIFVSFYTIAMMLLNVMLAMGKSSVWIFPVLGALVQMLLIFFFHENIYSIITANIITAALLSLSLYISYRYAIAKH